VPGNHEYYSNGAAFYAALADLPRADGAHVQEASHFALRYGKFVLQGADTSFNDRSPIATAIRPPLTRLVESEQTWHAKQLADAAAKGKRTLLFSHHMLFTSTSSCGTDKSGTERALDPYLLESFGPFFKKPIVAWFWGHDHNMAAYEEFAGLPRGRLVGHSAIPVKSHPSPYKTNAKLEDQDLPTLVPQCRVGGEGGLQFNGFATLTLKDETVDAKYYEVPRHSLNRYGQPRVVFHETF